MLVGGEAFAQAGTNTYSLLQTFGSDAKYRGEVRDKYEFLGLGASLEIPLVHAFAVGGRVNAYSRLYHHRSNTLYTYNIYSDGHDGPVEVGGGSSGNGFSLEIYFRMGLRFGY